MLCVVYGDDFVLIEYHVRCGLAEATMQMEPR